MKRKRNFSYLFLIMFLFLLIYMFGCNMNSFSLDNKNTEKVYKAFQSQKDDKDKLKEIIKNLDGIDWKKYEQLSNNKSMDLLTYISKNIGLIDKSNFSKIFKATKNLDGAYAEEYSSIVGQIFLKNKTEFIKVLSSFNDDKIKEIADDTAYGCSNQDIKPLRSYLADSLKTYSKNAKERRVVEYLIRSFDKQK